MVLVPWDFLAIIPLSTDKLVSHGKLFFCLQPVSRLLLQLLLSGHDIDTVRLRCGDWMA